MGWLGKSWSSVNPYFVFTQTLKRFGYAWFMFTELAAYCQSLPRLNFSIRKGTHIATMQVITRSFPFFLFFYDLFYPLVDGSRIKLIPFGIN